MQACCKLEGRARVQHGLEATAGTPRMQACCIPEGGARVNKLLRLMSQ